MSKVKRGHMNFQAITEAVAGRPGYRFTRWGWWANEQWSQVWLEYRKGKLCRCMVGRNGKPKVLAWIDVPEKDKAKKDWYVLQGEDNKVPVL